MVLQNLTLRIPGDLYEQIKERAQRREHSIEDETIELLASAVPGDDALPADLLREVDEMRLLDDEELWAAARSHLAVDTAAELEDLTPKRSEMKWIRRNAKRGDELLNQYDRAMIIRASCRRTAPCTGTRSGRTPGGTMSERVAWLREQIENGCRHRCGYCLTSEAVVGTPMDLEHIIPEAMGGATIRDNLWLACSRCNGYKAGSYRFP